jgi:hypothetical protein
MKKINKMKTHRVGKNLLLRRWRMRSKRERERETSVCDKERLSRAWILSCDVFTGAGPVHIHTINLFLIIKTALITRKTWG